MSVRTFGINDGSTLVLYKGYPTLKRTSNEPNDVWEVVYRYWCQHVLAEGLIPEAYAACPHPDHTNLLCLEVSISENGKPGLCDVTITYKLPSNSNASLSVHRDTDVQQSTQGGWMEIPLEDTRLVSSGFLTSDQVKAALKNHHKTASMGTVDYSYTEWLSTFSWDEEDVVAHLGEVDTPVGINSPTSGRWLRTGLNIRTDGNLVERTKTWRYNALGWKS